MMIKKEMMAMKKIMIKNEIMILKKDKEEYDDKKSG